MRGHFHSWLSKVNFKSKNSWKLKIIYYISVRDFELLGNMRVWFGFVSDDDLKLCANLITLEFDFWICSSLIIIADDDALPCNLLWRRST